MYTDAFPVQLYSHYGVVDCRCISCTTLFSLWRRRVQMHFLYNSILTMASSSADAFPVQLYSHYGVVECGCITYSSWRIWARLLLTSSTPITQWTPDWPMTAHRRIEARPLILLTHDRSQKDRSKATVNFFHSDHTMNAWLNYDRSQKERLTELWPLTEGSEQGYWYYCLWPLTEGTHDWTMTAHRRIGARLLILLPLRSHKERMNILVLSNKIQQHDFSCLI